MPDPAAEDSNCTDFFLLPNLLIVRTAREMLLRRIV
jgi:hypothetical protein